MSTTSLVVALLLAFSVSAVSAQSAAASAPAAQAKAQAAGANESDPERQVCKTERAVGSLIPSRVCKTAAQWKQESEASRKLVQDLQQRTGSTSGGR